jgi:hypothetical protein
MVNPFAACGFPGGAVYEGRDPFQVIRVKVVRAISKP